MQQIIEYLHPLLSKDYEIWVGSSSALLLDGVSAYELELVKGTELMLLSKIALDENNEIVRVNEVQVSSLNDIHKIVSKTPNFESIDERFVIEKVVSKPSYKEALIVLSIKNIYFVLDLDYRVSIDIKHALDKVIEKYSFNIYFAQDNAYTVLKRERNNTDTEDSINKMIETLGSDISKAFRSIKK